MLGAAEGAGAGAELLLLLVVPNRLGVEMEDVEVVELVVMVGLLARKENAGLGASVRENKVFLMVHSTVAVGKLFAEILRLVQKQCLMFRFLQLAF